MSVNVLERLQELPSDCTINQPPQCVCAILYLLKAINLYTHTNSQADLRKKRAQKQTAAVSNKECKQKHNRAKTNLRYLSVAVSALLVIKSAQSNFLHFFRSSEFSLNILLLMSTFSGRLDEIEHVSIDRFNGLNLKSKLFFLSHCHSDHMIGLSESERGEGLPGPLYLSEMSAVIIRRRFPKLKGLVPLKIAESTIIADYGEIEDVSDKASTIKSKLSVTAIPAGHCPGSVMFLFEQNDKKVLYTGDFRLYRTSIESIVALKKFQNENTTLDCVYLDSTFLSQYYVKFPTQRESIDTTINLIENWLRRSHNNVVLIRPPAAYGYEFLMAQLSEHFKQKIHNSHSVYKDLLYAPEFDLNFTDSQQFDGRIHLCPSIDQGGKWFSKSVTCLPALDERNVCIIRPTAMKWKNWHKHDKNYEMHEDISNVYFVCYSTHSSYEEIKDLLVYLKPKSVKLNVIPNGINLQMEMYRALDDIVKEYKQDVAADTIEKDESSLCNYDAYSFQNIVINNTVDSSIEMVEDEISHLRIKRRKKL